MWLVGVLAGAAEESEPLLDASTPGFWLLMVVWFFICVAIGRAL